MPESDDERESAKLEKLVADYFRWREQLFSLFIIFFLVGFCVLSYFFLPSPDDVARQHTVVMERLLSVAQVGDRFILTNGRVCSFGSADDPVIDQDGGVSYQCGIETIRRVPERELLPMIVRVVHDEDKESEEISACYYGQRPINLADLSSGQYVCNH